MAAATAPWQHLVVVSVLPIGAHFAFVQQEEFAGWSISLSSYVEESFVVSLGHASTPDSKASLLIIDFEFSDFGGHLRAEMEWPTIINNVR